MEQNFMYSIKIFKGLYLNKAKLKKKTYTPFPPSQKISNIYNGPHTLIR